MENKNIYITGGVILVIGLLVGSYFWWGSSDLFTNDDDVVATTTVITTNTTNNTNITNTSESELIEKAYTQTRVKENGVFISTVSYTSNGFEPAIVYINRGEAVRFIDKSEGSMRIASNDFQGNVLYPGFTQASTVGRNGTYEFTFSKSGVWGYYNMNSNPKSYGIVYVR